MLDTIIIIVLWLFIGLCVVGIFWAKSSEKKQWNNGRCEKDGRKWKHFDTDSQGGRGYKCGRGSEDNSHYIWVSYDVDK